MSSNKYTNEQYVSFLRKSYDFGVIQYNRIADWDNIHSLNAECSFGNADDVFADGMMLAEIYLAYDISKEFPEEFPNFWKQGFFG